jgi:hypothetical protein
MGPERDRTRAACLLCVHRVWVIGWPQSKWRVSEHSVGLRSLDVTQGKIRPGMAWAKKTGSSPFRMPKHLSGRGVGDSVKH